MFLVTSQIKCASSIQSVFDKFGKFYFDYFMNGALEYRVKLTDLYLTY